MVRLYDAATGSLKKEFVPVPLDAGIGSHEGCTMKCVCMCLAGRSAAALCARLRSAAPVHHRAEAARRRNRPSVHPDGRRAAISAKARA